jgi:hypothetical protein
MLESTTMGLADLCSYYGSGEDPDGVSGKEQWSSQGARHKDLSEWS